MGLFALLTRFLPRRECKPQFAYVPIAPQRLERRRMLDAAGAGLALEAIPDAQPFVQTAAMTTADDAAEQPEVPAALQGGPQVTIRLREAELFEDQSTLAVVNIADDFPMAHQLTIDWGDGSAPTVINTGVNQRDVLVVHKFLDDPAGPGNGSFTVTATITNTQGETATSSTAILVKNVAPKIDSLAITSPINENGTATLTGTYSDAGTLDTHTLDIDWNGDGAFDQSVAVTGGTFSVSRQILDDNPTGTVADALNVNVRLRDDDGGQATGGALLIVRNVPPTITNLSLTSPVTENGTATLTGTYTDPGTRDTHTLDIDWDGDGTFDQTVAVAGGSFSVTHQFLDDNPAGISDTFPVQVRLRDDDGGQALRAVEITVSNTNPTVVLNAIAAIDENGTALLTGTYSDVGTQDTHELDIDWDGDGTFDQTVAVTGGAFTVTRQILDDNPTGTLVDQSTVTVRLRDDDGGVATDSKTLEVRNVNPTVVLVPPSAIEENGVATLNGTITDVGTLDTFSLLVTWGDPTSLDNVQVFELGTTALTKAADGIDWDPATRQFSIDHQYLDDNPSNTSSDISNILVNVTDDDTGGAVARTTVTVRNVDPVLAHVAITTPVVENDTATLTGTYTDVGSQDTHELDIDWDGDGTFDQTIAVSGGSFTVSHQFLDDNPTGTLSDTFNVNVRLRDDDGGMATESQPLTVQNANPTVTVVPPAALVENGIATLNGTIADTGTLDTFSLLVTWGDPLSPDNVQVFELGTTTLTKATDGIDWNPTTRQFSVDHQYLDDNPSNTSSDGYNILVNVTDDDTGGAVARTTVTVQNADPILTAAGNQTIDEGATLDLTSGGLGFFTDQGTLDTHTATVNWGDGTGDQTVSVSDFNSSGNLSASHIFADDGMYTVTVTLVDDDGGTAVATLAVTVNNVPPVLTIAPDQTVDEGAVLDLNDGKLGTFTDQGVRDTHTATVDWGDGSGSQPVAVTETNGSGNLSANHIYADNGVYTVTVTLVDDDGGRAIETFRVTVANVDPTLTGADSPIEVDEGELITLGSLGVGLQDPGFDNFYNPLTPGGSLETLSAISVDWGDGTGPQALGIDTETDGGPLVPTTATLTSAEHAYADNGTYTVKVTVRDDDGGEVTREFKVIVNNVAPTLDVGINHAEINEGESIDLSGLFSDAGFDNDANPNGRSQENLRYEIDWGDGSAPQSSGVLPDSPGHQGVPTTGSFVVNHTYADNDADNQYTITVTLIDDDGGRIRKEIPVRVLNVSPTLYPLTATDVTTHGIATVTVDFDDPGSDTFVVHIDWGDGLVVPYALDRAETALPHTFIHKYDTPPDPDHPSAPITIKVFVTDDDFGTPGVMDLGISDPQEVEIKTPGIGAERFRIDTTPRVPQLTFPVREMPTFVVNNTNAVVTSQQTFAIGGSSGEAPAASYRYFELRVIDADGNESPGYPLPPNVLQDLPALFRTLPDNHYKIYVVNTETNVPRLVIEVYVRNGKMIDPGDDSEGTRDRPPTDEKKVEPAAAVPTEEAPVTIPTEQALGNDDQAAMAVPARFPWQRFSRWTVLAMGLAASSSAQTWAHQVDEALAKATAEQWRKLQGHNPPKPKKP